MKYIKNTVGRALTLGLAAITLHAPKDPINYLANYLLQFRYNQIREAERKMELEEILEIRREEAEARKDDDESEEEEETCQISRKYSNFE